MTYCAFVEYAEFASNVRQSASAKIEQIHIPTCRAIYASKDEFGPALAEAVVSLHKLPTEQPKALILSAHGVPRTGTNLEASDGDINLWHYKDYFTVLPPNLVVYVSVCFGGYPAMDVVQSDRLHTPYVIGPLVDIHMDHANAFQRELLNLMDSAVGVSRRSLLRLICSFNKNDKLRAHHYGRRQWLFGMRDLSGNFFPRQAMGNQLAAPVEDKMRFTVVDLVRRGESGNVVACVIEDDRGVRRQVNLAPLLRVLGEDVDDFRGRRFNATFQVSHEASDVDNHGEHMEMIHLVKVWKC
ncbi:Uncharacterised protein [Burkholderia pseudomallei]|nr:Uncharacterised protein [Burkholderia pseudomallei]CAJ6624486.1 Uncharacterised protein [Burkholderia pseudomallei]